MRAMIFAAGRGERLYPLTRTLPKPLVDVNGETILGYTLKRLASYGIREVVINVWYLADQIKEAVGDGSRWGVDVAWSHEETGGGVRYALDLLGEEPILTINGDIMWAFDLIALMELYDSARMDGLLIMTDNPTDKDGGDFRIHEDGHMTRDKGSPEAFTYTGIQLLNPVAMRPFPVEPFPLNRFYDDRIAAGRLFGCRLSGRWADVGSMERLERVRREWGV